MTTSTPPAWHFLHECDVPVEAQELPVSATLSKQNGREALSADSRNLSYPATLGVQNDSNPDPTYQDCWPSERYKSDAPECESDAQLTDAHSNAAPSHRIGTRSLDPNTGEYVMMGDFFDGESELRWMPDKDGHNFGQEADAAEGKGLQNPAQTADSFAVTSCPECGAVADIDYGTVKDKPPDCQAYGEREPDRFAHETPTNLGVGARNEHPDAFDVPYAVQSWLFEALIESEIDHLHEIIDDHHDEIVAMARRRHRTGHVVYGSKGYQWDAKTRLRNVLEELADGGTYLTMGEIE